MQIALSDLIAIVALIVSVGSATYTCIAAREAKRTNQLAFRSEWMSAYRVMLRAYSILGMPEGRFASLTERFKRGYPLPLNEELVRELHAISVSASLWSTLEAHSHLENTLRWNRELEFHLENGNYENYLQDTNSEEAFRQNAADFAAEARNSLESAIKVVRTRLRESAP